MTRHASETSCLNSPVDGCRNSRRCLALGSDEAVGPVGAGGCEDSAAAWGGVNAEGAGADPLVVPVLVCGNKPEPAARQSQRYSLSYSFELRSTAVQRTEHSCSDAIDQASAPRASGFQSSFRPGLSGPGVQRQEPSRRQGSLRGARTPPSIARSPDSRAANRQDRECLRCSIAVCRHRQAVIVQLELAAVALVADDRLCRQQNSDTGSAVVTEGIANAASSSERRQGVSGSQASRRRRANRHD